MKRNIFKSTLISALAATLLLSGCASGEKRNKQAVIKRFPLKEYRNNLRKVTS